MHFAATLVRGRFWVGVWHYHIPKHFYSKPHKSLTLLLFLSGSGRDTSLKKWVLMAALELCPWLEFFFFFSPSISVNCEVWRKPKTHIGRIFSFGRYLPKHTRMTKMPLELAGYWPEVEQTVFWFQIIYQYEKFRLFRAEWNGIHNIAFHTC